MNASMLIEAHYLPCIAWFAQASRCEQVYIDTTDIYRRQTYRNRCCIRGANKVENLIVPVTGSSRDLTSRVRIDYKQKWVNNHRRAIVSAYGKAPYFEFFADEILKLYDERYEKLMDLNLAIIRQCLKIIGLKTRIICNEEPITPPSIHTDLREKIHPKNISAISGLYKTVTYFQVFGEPFSENLSIIDLLFCEGPSTLAVIKKSVASQDNFDK